MAKDARTMPAEANSPPINITGRQPKRFTRMLDTGPVGREGSPLGLAQSSPLDTLQALHLPVPSVRNPEGSV